MRLAAPLRPDWNRGHGLCHACLRLARLFGKDPEMFAYEPLHGWGDDRDAVELPWERWEQEARAHGHSLADALATADKSRFRRR